VNRHDAAPKPVDERVHDLEMGLQGGQGPPLVPTHETAVPCGVGAEDRGKLPISLFSGQGDSPRNAAAGGKYELPHRASPIASGGAIASRENMPKVSNEFIISKSACQSGAGPHMNRIDDSADITYEREPGGSPDSLSL
jgi:hypothetical protein